eukprot:3981256-Amphidinium_carterae.2
MATVPNAIVDVHSKDGATTTTASCILLILTCTECSLEYGVCARSKHLCLQQYFALPSFELS